ncbi:MAG: hypothetical protein IOD12_03515, partial [Silvanigrellales bacterium]|nr:hypothetical protein [Silvanigrellales bacterium]
MEITCVVRQQSGRWKQWDPRRNLFARLGLTIFAATFLTATAASFVVSSQSKSRVIESSGTLFAELALQLGAEIDRGLSDRFENLRVLSKLDPIRIENTPQDSRRRLLNALQESHPEFAWIGLTDAKGEVISSSGGLLEGTNVSARPWWIGAQKKPFFGDVNEAVLLASKLAPELSGEPLRFVDISLPLRNEKGELRGILGAHLSWSWVRSVKERLALRLRKWRPVDALILNSEGTVLLGPTPLLGKTLREGLGTGPSGFTVSIWEDGEEYISGVARTTGPGPFDGLGWTLVLREQTSTAFANASEIRTQIFLTCFGLGSLCAILGLAITRKLLGPLRVLTRSVRALREGTSQTLPVLGGTREVEELSSTLSELLGELQSVNVRAEQ